MIRIAAGDICEYEDCINSADGIVYSRKLEMVMKCCEYHCDLVVEQGHPEYIDVCPNCGCNNPIN